MKVFIIVVSLLFAVAAHAELSLDFFYDLDKQNLTLNGDIEKIEDQKYMLVIYKNGISVLREDSFAVSNLYEEPMALEAREGELLRVEIWGDNGLMFYEEITAGSNEQKASNVKKAAPKKAQSVLISDTPEVSSSILIEGDEMTDEFVEEDIEPVRESYGYKDEGNTSIGTESYGYKLKQESKKHETYGHKDMGYESKDSSYGHDNLGYESKDESYGRKEY